MLQRCIRCVIAVLVLAAWLPAGLAVARPPSPARTAIPLPNASTPAGTLLNYDRIQLPSLYRAKAWRIIYMTRDFRLRPIVSTGMVVLPDRAAKVPMNRRFVAWAHPTTGIARKCAPSLRASPVKAISGLNDLVAAGVVVTATDYPGLGTEGPMGYLVGKGQAYAVIDSVRAARQIPGVGGGRDYALWGYSQGGHAALFAADLSARYAPELNLKAVAAVAPPTDLARLMRANIGSVPGRILAAFTLASWNAKYGAPLQMLVDAAAAAVISEVGRSCVDDLGGKLDAAAAQKALTANFLKTDPARLAPWSGLLAENSRFAQAVRLPTLIIQGDSDDLVRPAVTTAFVKSSCRAGVPVQYNVLKGKGHGAAIDASARDGVNWLVSRLNNIPTRGNCR